MDETGRELCEYSIHCRALTHEAGDLSNRQRNVFSNSDSPSPFSRLSGDEIVKPTEVSLL